MSIRNSLMAALLGLTSITLSACVDDGYRRPGLVVVDRDYRSYDRRYDRYDRYDRRAYRDRRDFRAYRRYHPRDRACWL